MRELKNLSAIIDRYDGFIFDLWGVVHDGTHLYPGVHEALARVRSAGKHIGMLSNAPRRAGKVESALNELGIESSLYDFVMSSGEAGFQWMASEQNTLGRRYYYIGPDKDLDVTEGLNFMRANALSDTDFLLNVGFGSEAQTSDDWTALLSDARSRGLVMVCLNPDMEVVKITGERFPCAGVLGRAYEAMGGQVIWFGKPYPAVYEVCYKRFMQLDKSRLLAIGDSIDTDIAGAAAFGFDSLLITGGILKDKSPAQIDALCAAQGMAATYIMRALAW